jgi:hypothetical protein
MVAKAKESLLLGLLISFFGCFLSLKERMNLVRQLRDIGLHVILYSCSTILGLSLKTFVLLSYTVNYLREILCQ